MVVFGVDVAHVFEAEGGVPRVVRDCCTWVEEHGLQVVGCWRLAGDELLVKQYQDQYDAGDAVVLPPELDVGTVTGLIVRWLKSLPDGLFNTDEVTAMLAAKRDVAAVKGVVEGMAPPYKTTLQYLTRHWRRVALEAETNKMHAENMAKVVFMVLSNFAGRNPLEAMQFFDPIACMISSTEDIFADVEEPALDPKASLDNSFEALPPLEPDAKARVDEVFQRIDSDSSNALDPKEVLKAAGGSEQLSGWVKEVMDKNRNGFVEYGEWESFFMRLQAAGGIANVHELCDLFEQCLDDP